MLSSNENTQGTTPGNASQTSERRCENPECNVNKLISMVPKRKTTQFISEPSVMEKPMLVNGFTAVFQVDGNSAKLMDIKNPSGDTSTKSIYRIVPNSHVHVVNYVVVDTDESYLKKITDNDPATMQKLLTSQKDSADQMLKKIMSGQGSTATAATTTVVSTINTGNVNRPSDITQQATVNNTTMPPAQPANIPLHHTAAPSQATNMLTTKAMPKPSIKLPVRMHPNLKITAVASAETVGTASNTSASELNPPYIHPVPLANLQSPTAVVQQVQKDPALSLSSATSTSSTADVPDKPTYDKMQAEINDLRRTVAMLAEAQAKNQSQQQPGITRPPAKRARASTPK